MSKQTTVARAVRWAQLAALVVAVLLGLAVEPAAAQTRAVTLTVRNASGIEVYYLHMRLSGEQTWSDDLLGSRDTIPAGASRSLRIAPGSYDILALDVNGATVAESYGIRVVNGGTWTVPQRSTFTLVNQSASEVCYLYIAAVGARSWGSDVLGEDTTVAPGYSWTTTVISGRYNVRGLDCDGQVVFEEYSLNLLRNLRLTVE